MHWHPSQAFVVRVSKGTLGALSPADQARLDKARALLPKDCYSKAFDDCIFRRDTATYPRCTELNELWTTNPEDPVYKELEILTDKIPYCPAPSAPSEAKPNTTIWWVLGGLALLGVVGVAIAGRAK